MADDYPSPEKIGLKVGPNEFRFWDSVEWNRSIDAVATVKFTAPFEPARQDFRLTFEPFSYKPLEVTVGGVLVFTGTMMPPEPGVDQDSSRVAISGYARPGVLEDCPPPASAYPLEFSGMTLIDIAKKLCAPFGFTAVMDEDVEDIDAFVAKKRKRGKRGGKGKRGSKFDRVALEPGDDAHNFLVGLAQKRGLVMRDRPNGDLVFADSANADGPVANLTEGEAPVVSVAVTFKPQEYFSEITAFVPPSGGKPGSSHTVQNPFLTDVVRPYSFRLEDTDPADCPTAAVAKMGRMFANCVSWELVVPTWRDPNGDIWEPGTTLTLLAPKAMIYSRTELLIRNANLKQDANGESATISLVLPGAFDGAVPSELPWSE